MSPVPVLVVDDNPTSLKLTTFVLARSNYAIETAVDAKSALERIAIRRPRLILMDLALPGMDGFDLTRRLKADPETREITIVAITAYAMKGDEQRARAAGCDDYVSKPIKPRELAGLVARYASAHYGAAE